MHEQNAARTKFTKRENKMLATTSQFLPQKELSNIYSLHQRSITFDSTLALDLYERLRCSQEDLEDFLPNLDTSTTSGFLEELMNVVSSDFTDNQLKNEYQWGYEEPSEFVQLNLPFGKNYLLTLNRHAFANLLNDHKLSKTAKSHVNSIKSSVDEVIEDLFGNIPQDQAIAQQEPTSVGARLSQMVNNSPRYGVIRISDAQAIFQKLMKVNSTTNVVAGNEACYELNSLVTFLMEHLAGDMDFNQFTCGELDGYIVVSIPCNETEWNRAIHEAFDPIYASVEFSKANNTNIHSQEKNLVHAIADLHNILTANEIKAYAGIR